MSYIYILSYNKMNADVGENRQHIICSTYHYLLLQLIAQGEKGKTAGYLWLSRRAYDSIGRFVCV